VPPLLPRSTLITAVPPAFTFTGLVEASFALTAAGLGVGFGVGVGFRFDAEVDVVVVVVVVFGCDGNLIDSAWVLFAVSPAALVAVTWHE